MWRAALCLMAAAAYCQESQEFQVLSSIAPESGSLGDIKFRVAFTGTAEHTPAVIILDNAVTPNYEQACLAEELAAALPGLPNVPAYAAFGSRHDLIYVANMPNGLQLGLLSQLAYLKQACALSPEQLKREPVMFERLIPAVDLFRSLARAYSGRGPLRVFWLASDFGPYDWRIQSRMRPAKAITIANRAATGIVDYLAEAMSSASITLFPLVVVRNPNASGLQDRLSAARALAEATGGIAALATEHRGEGLRNLFAESEKLRLVRLTPMQLEEGREDGELKLQSPTGGWERRFVFPFRQPFERVMPDEIAMRVVSFDTQMSLGTGCPDRSLMGSYFHLELPAGEKSAASPLLVDVQYLRPNRPTLRQRLVLSRPGPLCIPITDDGPGNSFIVVAHDAATGWTGARRGQISPKRP